MSIKLDLTPFELDTIFLALQTAPLSNMTFQEVVQLMDKMNQQGQPQLHDMVVEEPPEREERE